jgi:hypothetical protein
MLHEQALQGTRDAVPGIDPDFQKLLDAMKQAAGALQQAGVPFLLGGGLAVWARGGPQTEHDVDFYVKEEDAERGLSALVDAGFRPEHPPEDWLLKAYTDDGTLVDLIYEPASGAIGDEHFARAEDLEVMALRLQVASLEDVLAQKLLALKEQEPDFQHVLEIGRAVREQIDWDIVREMTGDHPFAKAYFTLVEELGVAPQEVDDKS